MKKKLTRSEEFDILKLVLDKFLWFGVFMMAYGIFRMIGHLESLAYNFLIVVGGMIIFVIFMIILIKEYEFMK